MVKNTVRRKNYIIDTNVLMHDPVCIYNFEDNNVYIPIVVLEELDNLKAKEGLAGYQARQAARELSKIIEKKGKGSLADGISLGKGIILKVELDGFDITTAAKSSDTKNDNIILGVVKDITEKSPEIPTILVSKDVCLRIKAEGLGLLAEDYETDKAKESDLYKGYGDLELSEEDINKIFSPTGLALPKKKQPFINEFAKISAKENPEHTAVARFNGKSLVPFKYDKHEAWGLRPINLEQKMAFELLMDSAISFVSITGGAGSGKTILATAVALEKVIEQKEYKKIVLVRPTVAAGNDIGYLPGSEEEKLRPWMGSFYDAIENLVRNSGKDIRGKKNKEQDDFRVDTLIESLIRLGYIEMKTFTYMRGRTLTDAFVIVDEAQEITPHLAKLMLTRAGANSKFVFLGDPTDNQIDNMLVDARSNGLVYIAEKMKNNEITGHVTLKYVERSPLANLAEKTL